MSLSGSVILEIALMSLITDIIACSNVLFVLIELA